MIRLCIRQLQNLEPGSGKAETHWFTVDQKRIDGADSVLNAGGRAIGVESQVDRDESDGRRQLIRWNILHEVMSKVSLKQLDAPCILYNLNGYYNSLKELLNHMIEKGLSDQERQKGIFFADDLMQIQEKLSFVKADGEK